MLKKKKAANRNRFRTAAGSWLTGYLKSMILILTGICMVAGVSLIVSEFETKGRGHVYAVESSVTEENRARVQTGLMGLVDAVSQMETYARQISSMDLAQSGSVLAGVSSVERSAGFSELFKEGRKKTAELGVYVKQTVRNGQISEEDYEMLLRIVEAEATGGELKSKMLVAGVVMNRVRDERFPDTISEVVWQTVDGYPQFQPTADGRLYSCEITESTVEAVDRVLMGEDLTRGALFFLARNGADASSKNWFDSSLVKLFEYGGHEFYTF